MTDDQPIVYTVKQAAALLASSERSIRRSCQYGVLPAVKIGRQWRIRRSAIEELLEQRRRFADIITRFPAHSGPPGAARVGETER